MPSASLDVDTLLRSTELFRRGGRPPAEVLLSAGVATVSDEDLLKAARSALEGRPDLVEIWQQWSYDKRWSPSPYLDGVEVGHYDSGKRHVRHHQTAADACADFVLAEARWVVERRVVEG